MPFASRSAERLWQGTENLLDAAIKSARAGRLHDHRDQLETVKDCLALHLVRSHRYMAVHRDSVTETVREVRRDTLRTRARMLENEFFRRHGLHAAGPDALGTIVDGPIEQWLELDATGAIVRTSIEDMFLRVREAFRKQSLEVGHAEPGRELLISDAPAVTMRYVAGDSRTELNVAIGDSHAVAMPLARDCLVALGPVDRDDGLTPEQVDYINTIQVVSAHEYVYYRPGSGLRGFVEAALSRGRG